VLILLSDTQNGGTDTPERQEFIRHAVWFVVLRFVILWVVVPSGR
jgi:hypothetical protein